MTTGAGPGDPGDLASAAAGLREPAALLRSLVSGLARHAPDAGGPPAPDAVAAVQSGALAAVESLAEGLEGTAARLLAAARALHDADAAAERLLRGRP